MRHADAMQDRVTQGERIAAELRRAWNGAPWHGPCAAEVIGRVTARQAATRRARGSNTPWQLVLHLTTWVETPLRRMDDPAYEPGERDNFPEPSSKSVEQWQHDVAQLGMAIERLAQRVALMTDEALAAPVGARSYSFTTMLDGVAQHVAYHAGQVAILARNEAVAGVIAPPPLIILAAAGSAEVLRLVYDVRVAAPLWSGFVLAAAGAALIQWAHEHFAKARTPAAPWQASRALVLAGPYRFSRNPMYVGALLVLAGAGLARANAWYIVLLPIAWAMLHWGVVLREERYLLQKFGAPYQRLLDSSRRWL